MSGSIRGCGAIFRDGASGQWLAFTGPVEILSTSDRESVVPLLQRVEQLVEVRRLHAAGFVSYEAAPAFDPALVVHPPGEFPLLWFALYQGCTVVPPPSAPPSGIAPLRWNPSVSEDDYRSAIRRIKEHIRDGDTYQVNFTFRLYTPFSGEATDLFAGMIHAQGDGYGAYVDTGRWAIASASPELFFRLEGGTLTSKPMKGTARRGRLRSDDLEESARLQSSPKNRAENIMIVDMVRNDLGRVAEPGSVEAKDLCAVEQYPTLWQMTSTVSCRTAGTLGDIFTALFPAASITGAPKIRTTAIIRDLESTPRRLYTGALGFLTPGRRAQFNVAIRTLLIDRVSRTAEYGTGSGVVWDSEERSEYQECLLKAEILFHRRPAFDLLETLRWTPGGEYLLLDRHLERLLASAAYFGRRCDRERILDLLRATARDLPRTPHRVRLVVPEEDEPSVEAVPLSGAAPRCIALAAEPVSRSELFLYHKTTYRTVYEAARAALPGFNDVLLWNEEGEITESCIANVVVEQHGRLLTPPLSCGLLPGVYRSHLLEQGVIREAVVRVEDLSRCSRIFLINAVREMWEVELRRPGV